MADPRHLRRMKLVQNLFASSFQEGTDHLPNPEDDISDVLKNLPKIDALIAQNAPKYPLDRIAKADLAVLRLSLYELLMQKTEPPKVIIDEAVTLAKEFGSDRSYAFINAVLGAIYKTVEPELKKEELNHTPFKITNDTTT